jgi:hypothetical protein
MRPVPDTGGTVSSRGLEAEAVWQRTDLLFVLADGRDVTWIAGTPPPEALRPWLPFAIVSAYDPDGRRSPPAENAARDAILRARLGPEVLRASGRMRGGPEGDAGFALPGRGRAAALAIAREFGQLAIYWCTAEGFDVVRT